MLNVKKIAVKNTADLLDRAVKVAHSFGFSDLDEALEALPSKRLKAAEKVIHAHPREKAMIPIMRKLATKNVDKTEDHILGYHLNTSNESPDSFSLNISGTDNPIAEATLIATAYTLLEDVGIKNATVHVNSLGTAESFTRYMRDLTKYIKKISKDIPTQVQTDLAVSPLRAYARLCSTDTTLAEACPHAIDYLNDDGRSHLWGLLEYLEASNIPYILDNTVTGGGDFFEQTLFEIKQAPEKAKKGKEPENKKSTLLAYGGRYSILGRKAFKKQIPTAGLTIDIKGEGPRKASCKDCPKTPFYFAQLGISAKKLGLKVINMLHKADINVHHSMTQGQLTKQMGYPEATKAPYVIIIGQKEAIEDSVIVRDTSTHKQKIVPTDKLVQYLKRLQK